MSQLPKLRSITTPVALFFYLHWHKITGILLWGLLLGGYFYYLRVNDMSAEEALHQLIDLLQSPWGIALYIFIYTISPLIFFSAAVLAIVGGAVFGVGSIGNLALAILYTVIGSLGAAQLAYLLGRAFGADLIAAEGGWVYRYTERVRKNSFVTILIMHAIFLPYELVNYLAGVLRIDWKAFLLATFLGSLPGLFTFVSFGASLDLKRLMLGEHPEFSPGTLLFGLGMLAVSLAIASVLRRRETKL